MDDHFSFAPDDPVRRQLGLGAAALRYQAMGYAVLPLAREAKKPHRMLPLDNNGLGGGVHWATRDERMPWWAWGQDPAAGIGVACGAASRLLVVDLDVKGTADGRAEMSAFMERYRLSWGGEPPIVSTPSGGQHLWFRIPPVRVMITGSRAWADEATIGQALAQHWGNGDRVLVSGGCPRGADAIAERIWASWGGQTEVHRAEWGTGRDAGFRRNTQMAESGPAACLAFIREASGGAAHAAAEAERCVVPVRRWVWPGPQQWPEPVPLPPSGVPQRLSILPGVDIKGDGGYVVAPPSMIRVHFGEHGGDRGTGSALVDYRWHRGCACELPDAPSWLFEWIEHTPALGGQGSGAIAGTGGGLEELQASGLPQGQRNNQLYLTACSLYGRYGTDNAGQAAVWAQIQPVLQATERAGFSDHEVGVVLASARRFIERKRREEGNAVNSMDAWKMANGMPG